VPDGGWQPAERLALTDALEAYSSGVAHQAYADAARDLVQLDRDPRSVDPHDLRSVRVLGTWVNGVRRA
jgi:predicted amidohydrolase YtcJ